MEIRVAPYKGALTPKQAFAATVADLEADSPMGLGETRVEALKALFDDLPENDPSRAHVAYALRDALASEYVDYRIRFAREIGRQIGTLESTILRQGFEAGFEKAFEILGEKL